MRILGLPGVNRKRKVSPNLYSLNVQTGTDALQNVTGFSSVGDSATLNTGATIVSSTEQAYTGYRSLKVSTLSDQALEGTRIQFTNGLLSQKNYYSALRVKGTQGVTLQLVTKDVTNAGALLAQDIPLTGGWDMVYLTPVIGANPCTDFRTALRTKTAVATTFYVDNCELRKITI